MKHIKKVFSLLLAFAMTMGMATTVFAAEGKPVDESISVSGLETGDTVNFYQVLKFDETATTTGGWVAAPGFTGLTTAQIQKMLGLDTDGKPVDTTANGYNADDWGIDAALAGSISLMAQNATAKFADVTVISGAATQATTKVGDAGLYVALVTPGTTDKLYNPVFVAADYTTGGTNTQEAVTTLSYSPEAMAKKEDVTLTKEVTGTNNGTDTPGTTGGNTKYDVDLGDTVEFTISSKVPAYSSAYQNPTYVISDKTEAGLEIQGTPVVTMAGLTGDNALVAADYSVVVAADKLSFTVTMNATGLAKVAKTGTAQAITVTYSAKVTSLENATVSEKENEATVKFSNNPDDSTSYSLLEDKTRNYTFTIDGNLLGYTGQSYETDELIKTGKKADGTDATTTKKYHSGTTWSELSPLAGAKFALFKESPAEADYVDEAAATASTKLYTNTSFTGIVESDANGRLKIAGLDAGTYYLHEVSAPNGYIRDNRTFIITIKATYTPIQGGEYTNTDGIKVKYDAYDVLDGYTVEVNDGTGTTTSTYNIANKGEVYHKVVDKATYQEITGEHFAGDVVTPINNTQGTELPSTGGIGTTLFYVIGTMLVLGAGIVLVTKRRIGA
jgi:fimbrial isopeptide formation D2 family protein/LPXTG-motif cell wall-anchored protein